MSDIESLKERYLIVKRGLYFRPNNRGYTGLKREAGRYPASHAAPDCGETAIHEDEAPEYSPACWEETKLADKDATITTLQSKLAEAEKVIALGLELFDSGTEIWQADRYRWCAKARSLATIREEEPLPAKQGEE